MKTLEGFEPVVWGYNIRFYHGEKCIYTKMVSEKTFREEFRRHAPTKVVKERIEETRPKRKKKNSEE